MHCLRVWLPYSDVSWLRDTAVNLCMCARIIQISGHAFQDKMAMVMAETVHVLHKNAVFSSLSLLEKAIELYERINYCKLYRRRTRKIESTLKRTPKKSFNPNIVFTEIQLCCIHGGKNFQSRSTGKRPNQKWVWIWTTYNSLYTVQFQDPSPVKVQGTN